MARFLALLAVSSLLSAADPEAVKRIQSRFIAPCCWSESVTVHRSPAAEEMRLEIAKMVQQGKSEGQIVDLYVAKYGERILLVPRGARNIVLSAIPWLAGGLGLLGLGLYLRRLRARPAPAPATNSGPPVLDDFDL